MFNLRDFLRDSLVFIKLFHCEFPSHLSLYYKQLIIIFYHFYLAPYSIWRTARVIELIWMNVIWHWVEQSSLAIANFFLTFYKSCFCCLPKRLFFFVVGISSFILSATAFGFNSFFFFFLNHSLLIALDEFFPFNLAQVNGMMRQFRAPRTLSPEEPSATRAHMWTFDLSRNFVFKDWLWKFRPTV